MISRYFLYNVRAGGLSKDLLIVFHHPTQGDLFLKTRTAEVSWLFG